MEQADIKVARVPLGGVLEPHDGPDLDAGAGLAQALRKVAKPLHDEREVKAYPAMQGETDNGSMTLAHRQYWKASLLGGLSDQMIHLSSTVDAWVSDTKSDDGPRGYQPSRRREFSWVTPPRRSPERFGWCPRRRVACRAGIP
jgi:hypothetical protein